MYFFSTGNFFHVLKALSPLICSHSLLCCSSFYFHLISRRCPTPQFFASMKVLLFLILLLLFNFFCLWVFCLHVCVPTTCIPGAQGDQERAWNLLEMELQTVVKHHVGAGNGSQFSGRVTGALSCRTISSVAETLVLVFTSHCIHLCLQTNIN